MNADNVTLSKERDVLVLSGWLVLPIWFLCLFGVVWCFIRGIGAVSHDPAGVWMIIGAVVAGVCLLISLSGFFSLQPNEARVLVLFGKYQGTVRESGFHFGNPFYTNGPSQLALMAQAAQQMQQKGGAAQNHVNAAPRKTLSRMKISLRARNFNGERLKVNDKRGNPIELAAVVVWRVQDTAQAMFDVEDYENYVRVQSESALRHLASGYAYDHGEENEVTLRSGSEEVAQALKVELQERLNKAGVLVEEARLTHLAYAPEIAQAMLRRQQAEAVIAARQKIVHGAVSMVDMALKELAEKKVVELDGERRAAMVSNLMVVLCGEAEVHPVINTGTLYT